MDKIIGQLSKSAVCLNNLKLNTSISMGSFTETNPLNSLGSIHTCDLLGVNYCVNYLLFNRLYCIKCGYSHLTFDQHELKMSKLGCVPIFHDCSSNSSHIMNRRTA